MGEQLSPHFNQSEFEEDAPIPAECVAILTSLCVELLEPIRDYIDEPMEITSGYRPPQANAAAHGVSDSEHIYTPQKAAADFSFSTPFGRLLSVRAVFDWIRNNPDLNFHQVILEHGAMGTSIIHISINLAKVGQRQALEGATHNASAYSSWPIVAYNPESGQENVNG